ncbi:MAG: ABC transporter permease [Clostridia bacterium]
MDDSKNVGGFRRIASSKFGSILGSMLGLIVLVLIFSVLSEPFRAVNNLVGITLQVSIYGVLACGIAFVLIIGGAELSAGSTVGLSGIVLGLLLQKGMPTLPSFILVLLCGAFLGAFNGFLVTKMHLIPFIATLGTQYMYRGFTYMLSAGTSISIRKVVSSEQTLEMLKNFGSGKLFGVIPMLTVVMFVFAVVVGIILSKTVLGRKIFATGSNVEAARLSGINTDRISIIAYAFSGIGAALAGIMLTTRLLSAQPTAGTSYELEGIAAAVIGGVSMMGGQGTISGAILGAFVVGVMRNGLNILGVNSFVQQVITGMIIIGAVYIDIMRRRREAKRK